MEKSMEGSSLVENSDEDSNATVSPQPLLKLPMLMTREFTEGQECDSPVWPVMGKIRNIRTSEEGSRDCISPINNKQNSACNTSDSDEQSEIIVPLAGLTTQSTLLPNITTQAASPPNSVITPRQVCSPAFSFNSESSQDGGLVTKCMTFITAPEKEGKLRSELSQDSPLTRSPVTTYQMNISASDALSYTSDLTVDPTAANTQTQKGGNSQITRNDPAFCRNAGQWEMHKTKGTGVVDTGKRSIAEELWNLTQQTFKDHTQQVSQENSPPIENKVKCTSPQTPPDQKRPIYAVDSPSVKSFVWKHFGFYKNGDILDKERTVCKLCRESINYNEKQRSTSSMRTHIKRKHPQFFEDGHSSVSSGDSVISLQKNSTVKRKVFEKEINSGNVMHMQQAKKQKVTAQQKIKHSQSTTSESLSSGVPDQMVSPAQTLAHFVKSHGDKMDILNKHEREANRLKSAFNQVRSRMDSSTDINGLNERSENLRTQITDIFKVLFDVQKKLIDIRSEKKGSSQLMKQCETAFRLNCDQKTKCKAIIEILTEIGKMKTEIYKNGQTSDNSNNKNQENQTKEKTLNSNTSKLSINTIDLTEEEPVPYQPQSHVNKCFETGKDISTREPVECSFLQTPKQNYFQTLSPSVPVASIYQPLTPSLPVVDTVNLPETSSALKLQFQPRPITAPSILSFNSSPERVIQKGNKRDTPQVIIQSQTEKIATTSTNNTSFQTTSQAKKQLEYPDLQQLIEAKVIEGGIHVISLETPTTKFVASLLPTGVIVGNGGEKFNPMSWYKACTGTVATKKNLVYSKVCYKEKPLNQFRMPDVLENINMRLAVTKGEKPPGSNSLPVTYDQTKLANTTAAGQYVAGQSLPRPPMINHYPLNLLTSPTGRLLSAQPSMPKTNALNQLNPNLVRYNVPKGSKHNQVYIATVSNSQNLTKSTSVQYVTPAKNLPVQGPKNDDKDDCNLSEYMRRLTQISLIRDNELMQLSCYSEQVYPSIYAQSITEDLEN